MKYNFYLHVILLKWFCEVQYKRTEDSNGGTFKGALTYHTECIENLKNWTILNFKSNFLESCLKFLKTTTRIASEVLSTNISIILFFIDPPTSSAIALTLSPPSQSLTLKRVNIGIIFGSTATCKSPLPTKASLRVEPRTPLAGMCPCTSSLE
ncbi:hypothetical protein BpHYR1_041149 [Brachionus plicatilis]|uniref:Uncharacterized protein n=1 Tax=Brachionus plicatilis TaxID=10195 RepID=A0A3M7RT23_BRAPC|nr:hypothetical protein BpHYR1_041149 [Brachionus plicatilis]